MEEKQQKNIKIYIYQRYENIPIYYIFKEKGKIGCNFIYYGPNSKFLKGYPQNEIFECEWLLSDCIVNYKSKSKSFYINQKVYDMFNSSDRVTQEIALELMCKEYFYGK